MRHKNFDKALDVIKTMEASQPKDPTLQNLKGGAYLGKEDLVHAKAAFEAALALKPSYLPSAINLAQIAVKEKHPDQARKILLDVFEKDKKNIETMNALAELAASQGNSPEATDWLEKAQASMPEAIKPAVALGNQYMRVGQKDKALSLVRKFQVANPKAPELLDLLTQIQLAMGDTAGALESASKLVGVQPKDPASFFRMANVHMVLKNETAASDDLKKALAIKPDFIDAQIAQARLLMQKGQYEGALKIARDIEQQRPKEAFGYILEGNLYQSQNKMAQAIKPYETAYGIARTTPNLIKLHAAMSVAGKAKEADVKLAAFEKDHPVDLELNMYVSGVLIAGKHYKEAIAKLEVALKLMPKNPVALNNLAWCYLQEKDGRALKTAQDALALAKDSPSVIDTVGYIMVEQGNTKAGLELLQKAVSLAPNAPEIRFHLATALAKTGDKTGAKRELDKVMANKAFGQIDEAKALAKTL